MAIYHLSLRTGTRAKGSSAAKKSDYIQREHQYERQNDKCFHKESGNLPSWAETGRDYWKAADKYERANGRLFVEFEVALPRDLDKDQQIDLARDFARDLSNGTLPFTLALHEGKGQNVEQGGLNPHAHLMMSERQNDGLDRNAVDHFKRANTQEPELGGALKTQAFHGAQKIIAVRELWAEKVNDSLELHGSKERVSHLSLEAQGIDREPGFHLGPAAYGMAKRGLVPERVQDFYNERQHAKALREELDSVRQELGGLDQDRGQEKESGLDYDYGYDGGYDLGL